MKRCGLRRRYDFTMHAEGFVMQQPVGSGAAAGDLRGYDKGALGFISLETLLYSPTLDPQLQTIADYVGTKPGGGVRNASLTSPLQLADELSTACSSALRLLGAKPLAPGEPLAHDFARCAASHAMALCVAVLLAEVRDIQSWAHLGVYFAEKLRAAVLIQQYRVEPANTPGSAGLQQQALAHLRTAKGEWAALANITSSHLRQDLPLFGMPGMPCRGGAKDDRCGNFSWAAMTPMVQRDIALAEISGQCYRQLHALCDDEHGGHRGKKCSECVASNSLGLAVRPPQTSSRHTLV